MPTLPKRLSRTKLTVLVCAGKDCKKNGSRAVRKALKARLKERGMKKSALLLQTKCTGNCKRGPICGFHPQNVWLSEADPRGACELLDRIIDET